MSCVVMRDKLPACCAANVASCMSRSSPRAFQWHLLEDKASAFDGATSAQIITRVLIDKKHPAISSENRDRCPRMVRLVESCWAFDPAVRPSFTEVVACLRHADCVF